MTKIERLSIDVSNYCSKQCPFCYNHSTRSGNVMWQPAEIIGFGLDCIAHGVKAISLGGGEPFEYEGIFEVIGSLNKRCYVSVTTNGLPLSDATIWRELNRQRPDKVHITIHNPDNAHEERYALSMIKRLSQINIKPGVNLLVSQSTLSSSREVYYRLRQSLSPSQIILVPRRYGDTPSASQLLWVANGEAFQSPSCLLKCIEPERFCSVSWDKKVNHCSYAGGREALETLDYDGLCAALSRVNFVPCTVATGYISRELT